MNDPAPRSNPSKTTAVRILHLEDEPDFSQLVTDYLASEGIKAEVLLASDLAQFDALLEKSAFDIILADFQLPTCTGIDALKHAVRVCPRTPFVLLSGIVREEAAIQALKDGATDFILKQSLGRLPAVIRQAMEHASEYAERKQAEDRLRVQGAALEAAANAIAITDRQGVVIWANPAFSRLTGYSLEEVIGQNPRLLKSGKHDGSFYEHLWQTIIAGKVWHSEMVNRHKDGHFYTEETTITPVLDEHGKVTHFIAVKQDISERKRAEAELEQTHGKLVAASKQAAVAEFATSILHNVGNVLNSVGVASECLAQSLKNSKSTRLSQAVELMVSHREELGGFFKDHPKGKLVLGYLSQLADKLVSEQAKALEEIAQLQNSVEHIKAIITLQQNSAKGAVTPEPIAPAELFEEVLQMTSNALSRRGIRLVKQYAETPPLLLQKHRVVQILTNLIRNAIQACEESGSDSRLITVKIERDDSRLRMAVADNGVGIANNHLEHIFSLGFTTKRDGHGFGLHGALAEARDMGGTLAVQSDGPGRGAMFTLELPLSHQST